MKSIFEKELNQAMELRRQIATANARRDQAGKQYALEAHFALLDKIQAMGQDIAQVFNLAMDSMVKGNEYIDLHDCIHESSVPALIESMRKCGIKRFTYSSTWSSAVKIIWLFLHNGCTQEGMTEVHTSHIHDDPTEMAPAFIFDIH